MSLLRLAVLVVVVSAAHLPADTAQLQAFGRGSAPAPTKAPVFAAELARRQNGPTSVCGYISTDSWACYSDEYCGFNSYYSAFGCCTGVAGQSLEGCDFATTCLDSTEFVASCGSACQANTLVGWCTAVVSPYCRKYYAGAYTGYDCGVYPGLTYQLESYPTGGGGDVTTTSSFSPYASSPSSSSATSHAFSPATTSSQSIQIVPFTESQQTATAGSSPEPASPTSSSNAKAIKFGSADRAKAMLVAVGSWFVAFL